LTAAVWEKDPLVPVLMYHRFLPDSYPNSTSTKMRLSEFQNQLQRLYDANFVVVPLESWLNGDLQIPVGKRPVIITMDDLFFADQIFLNADGTPSTKSGLGVYWQFAQQHPDFGFHPAIFFNLGDKDYANIETSTWFNTGPGWQDALAKVIVWCIENGASPYNHTFNHPDFQKVAGNDILWELQKNDQYLRDYLKRAGREDLIPKLGNMLALPFSIWPKSAAGRNLLMNYTTPEGKPMQAIFESDYYDVSHFMLAPYNPKFDRFHIPRTGAIETSFTKILGLTDQFPTAEECKIGPIEQEKSSDMDYVASQIQVMVQNQQCPPGVYALLGHLFQANADKVEPITLKP
jgi:peptidoglycan/xylan/chitin deacetylase (PgdA/CDA1 family)